MKVISDKLSAPFLFKKKRRKNKNIKLEKNT